MMVLIPLLKLIIKNVKVIQILMIVPPNIIKFKKIKKKLREKFNPFFWYGLRILFVSSLF